MGSSLVNPDMIILARESQGITQSALASAVQVSQGKMSKYENGLIQVTDNDLVAIAQETGYRPSFFYCTDRVIGLGSSLLFNRRQKTTPVSVQRQVQARVNIARMQVERLLRAAEVDSEHRLDRLDIDEFNNDPRAVARQVRAALRLPMGPLQNVTHAIESAGGLVVLCNFGTRRIDGAHLWLPDLPPLFFMNIDVSGDRHRFNLAHELGHAIMHEFPTSDIEAQANEFAAEFLMPSQEIRRELSPLSIERLGRLKQRWKVSMAALIYNAHRLGCISDKRRQILYATLNSMFKGHDEPIRIEMEQPVLLQQLLALHRKALGYVDEDFRALFMMDEPNIIEMGDQSPAPKILRIDRGPLRFDQYRRCAGQ